MRKFVVTVRSVSGGQFGGDIGAVRYLIVPDGADPSPSQAMGFKVWLNELMATLKHDPDGVVRGDILFFVHGFNNSITDVLQEQEAVATGLASNQFQGTIISFDWPSDGQVFAYLQDADQAKTTAIDLVSSCVKPLLAVQTEKCLVSIHALCHSMGAYVVREALDHADDGASTRANWTLNQLVLVAGDVDADDFVDGNKDTESMLLHCYRLTNYFSLYDEALQISNAKRIGVAPRVGRIGLPSNAPQKSANVDCSKRFQAIGGTGGMNPVDAADYSHSWYFRDANFFVDLAQTLHGNVDRTVVDGRVPQSGSRTLILKP